MNRPQFDPEAALVGAILLAPEAYWRVADVVSEEDFARRDLGKLWATCAQLIKRGDAADAVTIGERLPNLAILAVEVAQSTPSAANAKAYAELVAKRATERKVRAAGQRIASLTGDDLVGEAQRIISTCVPRAGAAVARLSHFTDQSMEGIIERNNSVMDMSGVPTGFEELDKLTGGWQATDLIVVAARPSVGKTAMALQTAIHAASGGTPVMFVTLEMNGKQLSDRALAHVGGINALHIRNPKEMEEWEWGALTEAKRKADAYPFYIDENANATVEAIAARVRQVDAEHRLGLVVIDYLTYIRPPKADKVADAIQEITRALKSLAKELKLPVILLSQLNREGEDAPVLKSLRDSGAIEQDADVVMFLHRPDKADRDLIKVIIGKQRNGPLGDFYLRADMARMRFCPTDYEPPRKKPVSDFAAMPRRAGKDAAAGVQ